MSRHEPVARAGLPTGSAPRASAPRPAVRSAQATALGTTLITFGLRSSFGLFTAPLSAAQGWSRDIFAVAMAIQNLLWGIGQPIAGALADRYGPARVGGHRGERAAEEHRQRQPRRFRERVPGGHVEAGDGDQRHPLQPD